MGAPVGGYARWFIVGVVVGASVIGESDGTSDD
jgi:hypothetical protein